MALVSDSTTAPFARKKKAATTARGGKELGWCCIKSVGLPSSLWDIPHVARVCLFTSLFREVFLLPLKTKIWLFETIQFDLLPQEGSRW